MSEYPSIQDAERWLANRKEHILTSILTKWLQAGLSISQCHQGLREIGWPSDEIPSRATLGRKIAKLRFKTEGDKPDAQEGKTPKPHFMEESKSENEHNRLTNVSFTGVVRPGFEDIHDIAESGAGSQNYDFS